MQSLKITVFYDTLNQIEEGNIPSSGATFKFDRSVVSPINPKADPANLSRIQVLNNDCVDACKEIAKMGFKCCMLNMASDACPGGGVKKGCAAQEEELCRRSNLYPGIKKQKYPLGDFEGLYTSDVTFFRQGSDARYKKYEQSFVCDVVSVAAYRMAGKKMNEQDKLGTLQKIRMILSIAHKQGCEVIVLSALGCGAYANDPEDMSQLFRQVLIDEGYAGYFDGVIFAIIDNDHTDNLKTFYKNLK